MALTNKDVYPWSVEHSIIARKDSKHLDTTIKTAIGLLWALTGRQYGVKTIKSRPCKPSRCTPCDRCDRGNAISLHKPAIKLVSVLVDGKSVELDGFALENNHLYRRGGLEFPKQDLSKPLGEPGTWCIEYMIGKLPPPGAGLMVALLTNEILNGVETGKCKLPGNWTAVNRQGVSITRAGIQESEKRQKTGIAEVDIWVATHNPAGVKAPSFVSSVDTLDGR